MTAESSPCHACRRPHGHGCFRWRMRDLLLFCKSRVGGPVAKVVRRPKLETQGHGTLEGPHDVVRRN
jgi:hypothetical protein